MHPITLGRTCFEGRRSRLTSFFNNPFLDKTGDRLLKTAVKKYKIKSNFFFVGSSRENSFWCWCFITGIIFWNFTQLINCSKNPKFDKMSYKMNVLSKCTKFLKRSMGYLKKLCTSLSLNNTYNGTKNHAFKLEPIKFVICQAFSHRWLDRFL